MGAPAKSVRIILLAAFMFSNVMYGMLVLILPRQEAALGAEANSLRLIFYAAAGAVLLASLYWTVAKLPASPNAQIFLTNMIVATAFAEACSICGLTLFFIAHKPAEFWPFAIAALLVQGLFILPRALQRA